MHIDSSDCMWAQNTHLNPCYNKLENACIYHIKRFRNKLLFYINMHTGNLASVHVQWDIWIDATISWRLYFIHVGIWYRNGEIIRGFDVSFHNPLLTKLSCDSCNVIVFIHIIMHTLKYLSPSNYKFKQIY